MKNCILQSLRTQFIVLFLFISLPFRASIANMVPYDFKSYTIEGVEIWYSYWTTSECWVSSVSSAAVGPVTIPSEAEGIPVKGIGSSSFKNRTGITSVTIPNSVEYIASSAFQGCTGLTTINIPNSVKSIGSSTFSGCTALTSCTIPNSVKEIETSLFEGCTELLSITIPNTITTIGNSAFSGCTGLRTIKIPNSVTTIGASVFSGCTSLTSVTLSNKLTEISSSMFSGCMGLTSFSIPNTITSIASSAFEDCVGLTSITIPNSVTTIGSSAFAGCTNLPNIMIPASVLSIGNKAFSDCNSLTSMIVADGNTVYDSRDNCNAIIETSYNRMVIGCKNSSIPSSVIQIYQYAFYNCTGLTEISFPSTINAIGNSAFYGCTSLGGICIPNSVKNIGSLAFGSCTSLTNVISEIKVPSAIPDNAFPYTIATLRVPYNTLEQYKATDGWKQFKQIVESDEMDNGDLFYETNNAGLTMTFKVINNITRECQLGDGNNSAVIAPSAVKLMIPEIVKDYKVVTIGNGALSGCSLLKSISFPSTMSKLNTQALEICHNLCAIQWNSQSELTASAIGHITTPNLLLYVKNKDYAPDGIQNVVVNGVAEKIVLQEAANGNDFYCPEEFIAQNIEFTHNYSMTSGYQTNQGWETIVLPFDVTNIIYDTTTELVPIKTWEVGSLKRPFWLYEQTTEGWKAATAIKGNIPYIICMPNNAERYDNIYNIMGDVTFKGENVKVLASDKVNAETYNGRTFVPNFQNQNASNSIYALNVNNKWDSYTSTAHLYGSTFFPNLRAVHPFECYMTTSDGSAREFIPIFEDNMPAGIGDALRLNNNEQIINNNCYNLNGQRVEHPKKGLYIINGRKVAIK